MTHVGQWRLESLELVNWGTFDGHHRVDVARKGFLLTGASGSGKSSLVDAVTAVLTPRGKTRFNAAAADASTRADDRTVLSYVRGAWRRAADDDTGEVATQYLRPGATWSGIALRFGDGSTRADGTPNVWSLVKLFHVNRGAATPGDVQDVHLLLPEPVGLMGLGPLAANGLDVRGLRRALPSAEVHREHSRFAARFTRVLGITGDRAILLLHKTQSAKNLGSLDELFRTFMLDEPTTFGTADRAVEQFTELSQAHGAVVDAREQIEHLRPLDHLTGEYDTAGEQVRLARQLTDSLEDFTAVWKLDLARNAQAQAHDAMVRARGEAEAERRAEREARRRVDDARAAVAANGGARLDTLDAQVETHEEKVRNTIRQHGQVSGSLADAGIDMPTSLAELTELQRAARQEMDQTTEDEARQQRARQLWDTRTKAWNRQQEAQGQLDTMRRSRSNIDASLARARQIVADATGLPVTTLPFAAELIQVRPEHSAWTGAVERVLRPLSVVMLVPAAHEVAVCAAVDAAHLGAHLRFESVPIEVPAPRQPSSPDSLVYRVEVADSPVRDWVHYELARRFDYLCVDSPAELARAERAVTRAGQVRRGRRSFEKDDRSAVDDRSRWVLGFDNQAKIDHFIELHRAAADEVAQAERALGDLERQRLAAEARRRALTVMAQLTWDDVDIAARERDLSATRQARADLLAADGDLRQSQHLLENAEQQLGRAQSAAAAASARAEVTAARLQDLTEAVTTLEAQPGGEVSAQVMAALEVEFHAHKTTRAVTYQSIDADSRKVQAALNKRERKADEARQRAETVIVALLGDFARRWSAQAGDLVAEIDDREGFRRLLSALRADRLPDFEHRFHEMLRTQSQQNIGSLAQEIRRAPQEIRRRVRPINDSLRRSEFAPRRYLHIDVDDARPVVVREFLAHLNTVTSGAFGLEEDQDEAERRFDVLAQIMRRLGSSDPADRTWRAQCLDTRRHVRFTGKEKDLDGAVVDTYDTAAGRSGGQKQKLVVFCLAAALRYQLTSDTDDVPSYGSVIMDEAFDKADAAFTRMALDIFREFGFHMILATPLKLLQTLEDYVGGIALVTNDEGQRSHVALVSFDPEPGSDPTRGQPAEAVGSQGEISTLDLVGLSQASAELS